MGFRFRRSVKLAPGLRLNISKRGFGLSAGMPGARVSVNSQGEARQSLGIPGTGMSWVQHLTGEDMAAEEEVDIMCRKLPGRRFVAVAGYTHHQAKIAETLAITTPEPPLKLEGDAIEAAAGQDMWFVAILERQPDNPHDENAVMVSSEAGPIGYLSQSDAVEYQDVLLAAEPNAGGCSGYLERAGDGMWFAVVALPDSEA